MTADLFEKIINTSQDCVFWKDKDRRFVGVNQAFLDYYGFESQDVLIGKTDEDMEWHSDPEPFKQDEIRVLSGHSTYKVQGKCIIRGEERDIIASKRPLYSGDEIVGLVGSFVDITDVIRRKHKTDGSQVLYSIGDLRKFTYFDKIIDDISLEEILDPLTGAISRAYCIKFIHALVSEKTPFTFAIIDLDNFKYINDNFGHIAGDKVLTTVAKGIADFLGENGLVGRFGGDELLIVDLKHLETEEKTDFFEKLYGDSDALRIKVSFDNGAAYITGTAGCASFPADEDDFSSLFALTDKMLYIGKNKGRNCYTVYEEEKHKDIEIRKIAGNGIFTNMHKIRIDIENEKGFENKLLKAMSHITEVFQITDLYYVKDDGRMRAVLNKDFNEDASDIGNIMEDDLFSESTLDRVKKSSPKFYDTLTRNDFETILATRIRKNDKVYGYIVCAVHRSLRIWQENECAILYYLAELLADEF